MIITIDVDYKNNGTAKVAGVLFNSYADEKAIEIKTTTLEKVAPYESGSFYKRELPCILQLLSKINCKLETIIIDGYVSLSANKKGLGMYLYERLNKQTPIIGVAKNAFDGISTKTNLFRGDSKKPLYITTAGMELDRAKTLIKLMHGKYRFPTLIKLADKVCREK